LNESKNQILLEKCTIEQDLTNMLEKKCRALFQISLLISADPVAAETALIETINELDICRGPGADSDARLENAVVMRNIAWPETRSSTQRLLAQSMLQPGLRLLTTLDRLPRICFVLRILLGYSADSCAHLLQVKESEIGPLLQSAALELAGR
jgi:DNA-directed RNA polymerase specialized sigma24 family protein